MAIKGQDMKNTTETAKNDPWTPLPQGSFTKLGDSEKYIQSLEKKLQNVSKKKEGAGPTPKDIISSLAIFHKDQMSDFINNTANADSNFPVIDAPPPSSFVHRKLYPEKQAISVEETLELVKEDTISKSLEEAQIKTSSEVVQLYPISEGDTINHVNQTNPLSDTTTEFKEHS